MADRITTYAEYVAADYQIKDRIREAQLAHQGGICPPCGATPDGQEFFADHDHRTGLLRGFVCVPCNHALAAVDRGSAWLTRAVEYADGSSWMPTCHYDAFLDGIDAVAAIPRRHRGFLTHLLPRWYVEGTRASAVAPAGRASRNPSATPSRGA